MFPEEVSYFLCLEAVQCKIGVGSYYKYQLKSLINKFLSKVFVPISLCPNHNV
jgi:hypothetical protein